MNISSVSSSMSTEDSVSTKSLQYTLCWRAHLAQAIKMKSIFTSTPVSETNEEFTKNLGLEKESRTAQSTSFKAPAPFKTLAPIPKKPQALFPVVLYEDNNDHELSIVNFDAFQTMNHDTKTAVDTDDSSQNDFDDDFQLFTLDD